MFRSLQNHLSRRLAGPIRFWHLHAALVCIVAVVLAVVLTHEADTHWNIAKIEAKYGTHRALDLAIPSGPGIPLVTAVSPPLSPSRTIAVIPALDQGHVGACQCYAFTRAYSHLVSKKLGVNWLFSCAFWYPLISQGHDNGSYIEQYPPELQTVGGMLTSEYNWPILPPQTDGPQPPLWTLSFALKHRYPLRLETISQDQYGGDAVIPYIEKRLSQGLMVNFGQPVYSGTGANGLFSTPSGGYEDLPTVPISSLALDGAHATDLIGYRRNLCIAPFGVQRCGWFVAINSWGHVGYGLNCSTLQPDPVNGGCYLVSYDFVKTLGFALIVPHLTAQLPQLFRLSKPQGGATGGVKDHGVPAPSSVGKGPLTVARGAYYVRHVTLYDASGDFGQAINTTAKRYGLYPPLLEAVLRTECGYHSTSTVCDNTWDGAGGSYGWCQVTTPTAAQFGIGSGNANTVRLYENHAPNCIDLAARVLATFAAIERARQCSLPPANLYVAWNAGPGQPCWFLLNPTGLAGRNFSNFAFWYRIALSGATATDPYQKRPKPAPPAFTVKMWGHSAYRDHKGHFLWQAKVWLHHRSLGPFKSERYHHPLHRRGRGYMIYRYRHGQAYCSLNRGTCTVVRA